MAIFYDIKNLPAFRNAVITIGTFDGVHHGHRTILKEVVDHARKENGESILITFEPHPRKLLFPDRPLRLLTTLEQKVQLVTEAGIEHIVVVPFTHEFANLSATEYISHFLVKYFHPTAIIIGYDHHFGHDRSGNIQLLRALANEYGYRVYETPAQLIEAAAVSSTKIRRALEVGSVEEAAQMLERPYSIKGWVKAGDQRGRTIGFPTANIQPENPDQLIPAHGVYAVRVKWNNQSFNGMLNIGINPTVTDSKVTNIEVNIFDFNQDIYNETLEVIFEARLRDEQKFPSLDALKAQLHTDQEKAKQILGHL